MLLLMLSSHVRAQAAACPDAAALDSLLAFSDLFLGEVHGTVESPGLVGCLVDRAQLDPGEPLIVSLELSELARNPGSPVWSHDATEDGRTSQAMYALVMNLLEKERAGLVELHFQHGGLARPDMLTIAGELRQLAERGKVIALAGNAHNMRTIPPGSSLPLQEGAYVGEKFTLINVRAANGGTFWACTLAGDCGVRETAPRDEKPGALADGSPSGHDYSFFVERFTASPPMHNRAQ